MIRYDLARILSGLICLAGALYLAMAGMFKQIPAEFAFLGFPALVAVAWCVGLIVGAERPAEEHEYCDPEKCIHRRLTGKHRKERVNAHQNYRLASR